LNRIAHIINPTKVREKSDLEIAQPITLESIRQAKLFAGTDSAITLYATHFEEENLNLSSEFRNLTNLSRSVLDFNPKLLGRKLPLIVDILAKADEMEEFDYLLFSNMDMWQIACKQGQQKDQHCDYHNNIEDVLDLRLHRDVLVDAVHDHPDEDEEYDQWD